ncbi:MAG: tRNA (mnm(5)s(2)U34)-methyltransferase [Sarcina sp.]
MFNYVNNVNNLIHHIIETKIDNKKIAIDATLGNGHDTDFLKDLFMKVYAFDIQDIAVENYNSKNIKNVEAIKDSHENFEKYINEKVDCIIYNLGYLPGADKHITTKVESTLKSIKIGLNLLEKNGIMFIAIYSGHEEGKLEKEEVLKLAKQLSTKNFGVLYTDFINRPNNPPSLLIIEKI